MALDGLKKMKYNDLKEKVMLNMHANKLSVEPMSLEELKAFVAENGSLVEEMSKLK